jgi:peptide/nickel transport system permease protein
MWKYTVRRLLVALPVLFVISVVDFAFIHLAPGDPLQALLPAEAKSQSGELSDLYERSGLSDSIPVQYLRWLGELAQGNLGRSFRNSQPTTTLIGNALPNTLVLTGTAMILSLLLGVTLGILSGVRERSFLDEVVTLWSFLFTGIPSFFLALIAVFFFSVRLSWLPATGIHTYNRQGDLADLFHHLALPATVLGVLHAPVYIRYTRAAILDVLREDYTRTARAKGLSERSVIARHALPNALLPILTLVGLSLPGLIGSSVLVEQVFAWPGMGTLSIDSALFRDYPVFMGVALLYAAAVLISSIVTDLAYALVNPRIRYA